MDLQAGTAETIKETSRFRRPKSNRPRQYNLTMADDEVQNTKVKVVAVPINEKENDLKLVSLNQYYKPELNGYKQFFLTINRNSNESEQVHCLREIGNYVININYVTSLSLRRCGIKFLPSAIGILPLKELDLTDNLLHHIPKCLYVGLQCLETLNISKNPINDFNVAPQCCLTLKVLIMEQCKFTNVPWWILKMKSINLEDLDYSYNELKDLKRSDLPQLPVKVKKLVFNNVGSKQHMLGFFKSFHLLQYLDLSNRIGKTLNLLDDINKLVDNPLWFRHLKVLKLCNLSITDLSEGLCQLMNLTELHLSNNSLMKLPQNMCNLKELIVLDVSDNYIYELPDLCSLNKLEELHASRNHLITLSIANMPRLKYVDLYNNELEDFYFGASSSSLVEFIDLEQNCVDGEILASCDNYAAKRDALRRSKTTDVGCSWRSTGRKLGIIELQETAPGGPWSVHHPIDDEMYSDTSDEEHNVEDRTESDDGFDGNEPNHDGDSSDWGDCGESNGLVTFSDSEFIPDETAKTKYDTKYKFVQNDLEKLFIDAD